MNIKELDKKLDDAVDLKKHYPGYFTKNIFRFGIALLVVFVITNLYLNNWSLYNVDISCPGSSCENLLWNNSDVPDWVCAKGLCDDPMLPAGFQYGRQDFLYKNMYLVLWSIVLGSVVLNHLWYSIKNKSLKYKGREYHESIKS